MYCNHCGKEINERKIEAKANSLNLDKDAIVNDDTKVTYVCPRCGHLIHEDLNETEYKELSRAAHTEVQRGHNSFAFGMGFVSIGIILLTIAIVFFTLAHKPNEGFQLVTSCSEFYVSVVLFAISFILLVYGLVNTVIGIVKRVKYGALLKDINNKTFIQ